MNGPDPLICPGAYDVLTARLIEVHGFKAAFVGSSAPNQELAAQPDQALVTVSEIIEYNTRIAANVDIPLLSDVDDFGATPLNVYRFAKQAERGGIGCASFDDRMPLNRATAYSVPGVVSKARMIDNIHAAADARTDMVLSALPRPDAKQFVHGDAGSGRRLRRSRGRRDLAGIAERSRIRKGGRDR
jgi:2,3-dimethylmalate lyase